MQRMAPGHARRFGFVDLIRTDDGRVRKGRGIGDEGFEEFAGIAHRDRIRHHGLRRLQVLFGRQSRPGVKQLAMHDRALQHHRAGADIVEAAIVIEGEHARRDQHELETARRQMKMEIGGAGIGEVDRQICRDFVQQEGFVVGVKAFVGAVVEGLRAIGRLVLRILVAIDRDEICVVQAERRAVRAREAGNLRSTAACTFMASSNRSRSTRCEACSICCSAWQIANPGRQGFMLQCEIWAS